MTRSNLMRVAVVLVVAEVVASIAMWMHLADRTARAEETGDQVSDGFERLASLRGQLP